MVVEGTATDKNGSVDLTCNGKDVLVNADGSFKATVSLTVGTNNIQFVAKNIYGIETTKSISVVREEAEEAKEEAVEETVSQYSKPVAAKSAAMWQPLRGHPPWF